VTLLLHRPTLLVYLLTYLNTMKWRDLCMAMTYCLTSTNDELLSGVNVDDLEWPWTFKICFFLVFLRFSSAAHTVEVNCDETDGDRRLRPRHPANRNCYGLSRVSWALLKLLVLRCTGCVEQSATVASRSMCQCVFYAQLENNTVSESDLSLI